MAALQAAIREQDAMRRQCEDHIAYHRSMQQQEALKLEIDQVIRGGASPPAGLLHGHAPLLHAPAYAPVRGPPAGTDL